MSALISSIVAFIVAGLAILGLVPHQQASQSVPSLAQQAYRSELNASANQQGSAPAGPADNNTSPISLPGMSKYTDPDFGFSFWYPSAWTIQPQQTSLADGFSGGVIKKDLLITDGQDQRIDIAEYYSANRTITIPESNCPAGDGCPEQRIYFDTLAHRWMTEYPNGDNADLPPGSVVPTDTSNNTMGGLHVFSGLARFDSFGIIPLSAENFLLISDLDYGIYNDPLVPTITATDPSVATPVSAAEQWNFVHKEALLYGTTGTSINDGQWYKDDAHVYDSAGNVVQGANPATFAPIDSYSDGATTTASGFATDGARVYVNWDGTGKVLQGADPATFVMIRQPFQVTQEGTGKILTFYNEDYEKDKSHVWDRDKLVPGADPATFVALNDMNLDSSGHSIMMGRDAKHVYGEGIHGNVTVDGVAAQQ